MRWPKTEKISLLTILGDFSVHTCAAVFPLKNTWFPHDFFHIYSFLLYRFAQSAWDSSSLYDLPLHLKSSSSTSHSLFQNSDTPFQSAHRSSTRYLQQALSYNYNLCGIIMNDFLAIAPLILQVPRGGEMVYCSLCFLMSTFLTNEKFLLGFMWVKYSVLLAFDSWHPAS